MFTKQLTPKQYGQIWDEFRENILKSTNVDVNETPEQKRARIKRLEKPGNEEEWFKYHFPHHCSSDAAPFHKAATRRIMAHPEWYEVRCWSRELAKSTRSMVEDMYLFYVGHTPAEGETTRLKKRYKIIISSSYDAAVKLFMPYMIELEANPTLLHDYGQQEKIGSWEIGNITTKKGFSIVAHGAGVIRGSKKENVRPDIIEFDDFDTDEACLNEDRVDKLWEWVNKAAIPTRSISKPTIVRWNGNQIAENCCVMRAQEFADNKDYVVNIRDKEGKSTWPAKNTEEYIERTLKTVTFSAQQSEYFNNPYTEGKAFKTFTWGKVPPLTKFPWLIQYGDPATSNKDAGKGNSKSSFKAVVLVGYLHPNFYVIKCNVNQMTNAHFVECYYNMERFVAGKAALFSYIENNALQDPFFEQVFTPLFYSKGLEYHTTVSIIPDDRAKPDKYTRIEGTLEPPNRLGNLIFNEAEKNDEHMKRLVAQLKSVSPKSKTMDGPDALEGAVWQAKSRIQMTGGIELFARPTNSNRY